MASKFFRFLLGFILFVSFTNNCLGNTLNENSPQWQTKEDDPSRRSQKDCSVDETNKPVPLPPTLITRSAAPLVQPIPPPLPHKVEVTTTVQPQIKSVLPIFRKDQPKAKDVVCIEKSKLFNLGDERLEGVRRSLDYDITEAAINQVSRRNEHHDELDNEVEENLERSGNDEQLRSGGYGNSFKCYACSNVSHSNCDQTSAMTTVKYCQRSSSSCVKKVIIAEDVPILIRDCGQCDTSYGGAIHCKVCNTELCNAASSLNIKTAIFITISGLSIIFATTKL